RHFDVNRLVDLRAELFHDIIQRFCLFYSSWETVEQEAAVRITLRQALSNDANRYFVRNKFALIHKCLSLSSKIRIVFNRETEHVSCRDMRNRVFFDYFRSLSTFTCTRQAHNNNVHYFVSSYLSTLSKSAVFSLVRLSFQLFHRLKCYTDNDQQARSANLNCLRQVHKLRN